MEVEELMGGGLVGIGTALPRGSVDEGTGRVWRFVVRA